MKTCGRAGNSKEEEAEEEESRMAASEMANDTFYIPRGTSPVNEACLLRVEEKFPRYLAKGVNLRLTLNH